MHIVSKGQCSAMMAAPSSSFFRCVLGFELMLALAEIPPLLGPCCDDTMLLTSICSRVNGSRIIFFLASIVLSVVFMHGNVDQANYRGSIARVVSRCYS